MIMRPLRSKRSLRVKLRYVDVDAFYSAPMLELEGWTPGRPLQEFVFDNRWNERGEPR